jgi:hypothetical protein
MLFKPWSVLRADLKAVEQSWEATFDEFKSNTTDRIRCIIQNTQYLHECKTSSDQKKNSSAAAYCEPQFDDDADMVNEVEGDVDGDALCQNLTEERLNRLVMAHASVVEQEYASAAIFAACLSKVLPILQPEWTAATGIVSCATESLLESINKWKSQMSACVEKTSILWRDPATVPLLTKEV